MVLYCQTEFSRPFRSFSREKGFEGLLGLPEVLHVLGLLPVVPSLSSSLLQSLLGLVLELFVRSRPVGPCHRV